MLIYDRIHQDVDGLYGVCHSPSWIHSDIMDDNIHMEPVLPTNGFDEGALKGGSIGNGGENQFITKGGPRKWIPTHIIDFSDLSIGELTSYILLLGWFLKHRCVIFLSFFFFSFFRRPFI